MKTSDQSRFEELFAEMFLESDRGCILIGASVLDDGIGDLLRKHLGKTDHISKNAMEPLFSSMGPLSSFSARIKLAYCLGLIDQSEFEDLERIRKIRNKAAHEYTSKTFTDNEIIQITQRLDGANRAVLAMKKFEAAERYEGRSPSEGRRAVCNEKEISKERLRFQMTVVFIAGCFHVRVFG